jgi:hypothetical protein
VFGHAEIETWSSFFLEVAVRHVKSLRGRLGSTPQEIEVGSQFVVTFVNEVVRTFVGIDMESFSEVCELANLVTHPRCSPARRLLSVLKIAELIDLYLKSDSLTSAGVVARWNAPEGNSTHEDRIGALMVLLISGRVLLQRALLGCLLSMCESGAEVDIDKALSDSEIVPWVDRLAVRDIEVCGQTLAEGDRLRLDLRLVANSGGSRSLPFGLGAHYCLGAPLTRKVCETVLLAIEGRIRLHSARTVGSTPDPIGGPTELWCLMSAM